TNIVLAMRGRGVRVRILPHTIPASIAIAPDDDGIILSPGPGDPARLRAPAARHLPRPSDRGPGRRRRDLPSPVRPPRREPPGPRRRLGARPGHVAEPRGPGPRRFRARGERLSRQPGEPQ